MRRILFLSSLLSLMGFNVSAEGYTLFNLDGGIISWKEEGFPIETDKSNTMARGNFEVPEIDYAGPDKKHLCGGYTEQREPADEEMNIFCKVMGEAIFTPLSVSTQVVAGLNYRFRCRYDDGTVNSPGHCSVTIWQPLQGEPVLTAIQDEEGGPEMKVIIDDEGSTARYIDENDTSYHGETQDDFWIKKDKAHIETVKACEGQGILTLKAPGKMPAFSQPDVNAQLIGTMIHEEGYIPEVYRCLGYIRGWFLTDIDGKAGFIQEDAVLWDAINTF